MFLSSLVLKDGLDRWFLPLERDPRLDLLARLLSEFARPRHPTPRVLFFVDDALEAEATLSEGRNNALFGAFTFLSDTLRSGCRLALRLPRCRTIVVSVDANVC